MKSLTPSVQATDVPAPKSTKVASSIPETAEEVGVGRSRLYEEIAAGRLKVRKVGARSIILHTDRDAWLASLPEAV